MWVWVGGCGFGWVGMGGYGWWVGLGGWGWVGGVGLGGWVGGFGFGRVGVHERACACQHAAACLLTTDACMLRDINSSKVTRLHAYG